MHVIPAMMFEMIGKMSQIIHSLLQTIQRNLRWLSPGLGIKRWIVVMLLGVTFLGLGLALFILDVYRNAPDTWWLPITSFLSLRFLDRWLRVFIFGVIGLGLIFGGAYGLNRAMLRPFLSPGKNLVDAYSVFRRRERGPRIVVMGGGTGLSSLLSGLKKYTHNLTAIVTVADDGGSSGELRRTMGILPPGDIRNCLAALSDDEALLTQLFQYRFPAGAGLNGHSFGNLFITALSEITGSFEEAVAESGRVLSIYGRVIPSTLHDVRLVADIRLPHFSGDVRVKGESIIPRVAGQVRRIWLEPSDPAAFPPAIQAILAADLIIVGPGSLYTSLLPNLLVPDISDALRVSKAVKFFVCNVATQPGETDNYTCGDHIRTIEQHMGCKCFDLIIANKRFEGQLPENSRWVLVDDDLDQEWALYLAELADSERPWRHDIDRLAQVVMDLFFERTGPLTGKDDV